MTEFIYSLSTVVLAAALFIALVLAIGVGFRIGRRYKERFNDPVRGHINAIQASMLGMVALLLAFTLSRSLEQFSSRSEAVVDEANAIGTAYLRAQLLPASVAEPSQEALRNYVDLRVEAAEMSFEELDKKLVTEVEQKQADLWRYAQEAAAGKVTPITSLFVQSINELIDSYGSRKAAVRRHVPACVILLLSSTFVLTAGVVGFASGAEGHRPSITCYFLVLFIVTLVFLIVDEQHLHTVNSPDAFAMGTRNTPDDAYNFAKGEAVKKNTTGEMVQKKTPYDWCAVTDHAEYLGVMPLLLDPKSPLQNTPIGKMIASGDPKQGAAAFQDNHQQDVSQRGDPIPGRSRSLEIGLAEAEGCCQSPL